jgi:hypothetical protein
VARDSEFNRIASEEFAREYERETGRKLKLRALPERFPDAVLEEVGGIQVQVEFVSVVLPFVWQEEAYFSKYRERFYEALRPARPRYQHVAIRLQPNSRLVDGPRPYELPAVGTVEGKRLIVEFADLLEQHFDTLRTALGLLIERVTTSAVQDFPTLIKYFDAIMLTEIDQDDSRKRHPDDPVLELPNVMYQSGDLAEAVDRALVAKAGKGPAYKADFLVLHTLANPEKPYFAGTAMDASHIERRARELLSNEQEICKRFDKIWFLNAYWTEGRRLYRLK